MINKVVDIYGTNKDDYVQVDRLNDDSTKVVLFNTSKKTKIIMFYISNTEQPQIAE